MRGNQRKNKSKRKFKRNVVFNQGYPILQPHIKGHSANLRSLDISVRFSHSSMKIAGMKQFQYLENSSDFISAILVP
jgi:hypothetical protein